ncbi:MAG: NUDIX domain-containing protein [Sphaerobacter thermophilus]|uniref:NUDIX hydrolase n=1 Tax=Sphaerobacter thermophilus TaxID=2057 RepID=UPI000DB24AFB|nr:MAG: DNA mismatch repair protein MutT [Sphaerobacter thermophilus]
MEPDPRDELFDVLTAEGVPTGMVKPRAAVHRDGDWHRSFHCWVVWRGPDGCVQVLFQRRSPTKDTVPNHLDVAVGGHYRSGETLTEVVREAEEELGLPLGLDDLVPVGARRAVGRGPGWVDREIQDVFVAVVPDGLAQLRPAPDEITALTVVRADDLVRLFPDSGQADLEIPALCAPVLPDRGLGPAEPARVRAADFVPVTDRYWAVGAQVAARVLAGERGLDLGLW